MILLSLFSPQGLLYASFYHLLCSLQGAGFQWLAVNSLAQPCHCSILATLQPQTKVLQLRQINLAHRLILLSWNLQRQNVYDLDEINSW